MDCFADGGGLICDQTTAYSNAPATATFVRSNVPRPCRRRTRVAWQLFVGAVVTAIVGHITRWPKKLLSTVGQKRTFCDPTTMSAIPPKADISQCTRHVR